MSGNRNVTPEDKLISRKKWVVNYCFDDRFRDSLKLIYRIKCESIKIMKPSKIIKK